MTLILTCIANDFIVQVADRKITPIGGPKNGPPLLDENKTLLWQWNIAWGFTGITPLEGEETVVWLARTLIESAASGSTEVRHHLQFVAEAADRAMNKAAARDRRFPHAFNGVGWAMIERKHEPLLVPQLRPIHFTVSNSIGPNGEWLTAPLDRFTVRFQYFMTTPSFVALMPPIGQPPTRSNFFALQRILSRGIKRGLTQVGVSATMQAVVRHVARSNKTVGTDLLITCIPRAHAEAAVSGKGGMLLTGLPGEQTATFQYSVADMVVLYGPASVVGTSYIGELTFTPLPGSPVDEVGSSADGTISVRMGLPPAPRERTRAV